MKVEFLGHAAFLITEGNYTLLFDPFLTGNPLASKKAHEVKPTHIFISHAHSYHLNAVAIAKKIPVPKYILFLKWQKCLKKKE